MTNERLAEILFMSIRCPVCGKIKSLYGDDFAEGHFECFVCGAIWEFMPKHQHSIRLKRRFDDV